jgi:hypothetical protein
MSQSGSGITEKKVVLFWQEQAQKRRCWSDSEGNPVEVLYPGRLNDGRGGDFQDALIVSNNGDQEGCIEVHTWTSRWVSHRHHLDPAYNRVILHVVWEKDTAGQTFLQNGQPIPTIALKELPRRKTKDRPSKPVLPCRGIGKKSSPSSIKEVLSRAGDARFDSAALKNVTQGSKIEQGQSLYEGIAEALGYSKNKVPFRTLAGFLPLSEVEEIVRSARNQEDALLRLQAALIGQAGLLPFQSLQDYIPDDYSKRIANIWSASLRSPSLSAKDWELFKVRPGNHPILRIAALSHLLYNWREKGFLETLLDLVREVPRERAHNHLESAFLIKSGGYWEDHYDFGCVRSKRISCLLGRPRAAEIVVNVLLPFCCGWGKLNSDSDLSTKAFDIYAGYPRLESNAIERHMLRQLSLDSCRLKFARYQQGFIHVYKNFCVQGKCAECPFFN